MRCARSSLAAVLVAVSTLLVACGSDGGAAGDTAGEATTLRLGYFPNLTHAPAIYGVEAGAFAEALGSTKLEAKTFNAGPDVVTALFAGELDAAFIGPNPAINAFQRSDGKAIRVIAGATSGGAALVTKPSISSVEQLRGKRIATPQLGNTQDVALRSYLASRDLETTTEGGGDVSIVPQENAQTLETFKQDKIDGAWVPEPWVSRLVAEGGGRILVDEEMLWPDGRYATTLLVVRTEFLEEHPDVVAALLGAHIEIVDALNADPEDARNVVNGAIEKLAGKALPANVLAAAFGRLTFVTDPLLSTIEKSAADAKSVGFLDSSDVEGIVDDGPLNAALEEAGKGAASP